MAGFQLWLPHAALSRLRALAILRQTPLSKLAQVSNLRIISRKLRVVNCNWVLDVGQSSVVLYTRNAFLGVERRLVKIALTLTGARASVLLCQTFT